MRPPLVFVLYMDGSLRVWNLLFTSIVAQLDLGMYVLLTSFRITRFEK